MSEVTESMVQCMERTICATLLFSTVFNQNACNCINHNIRRLVLWFVHRHVTDRKTDRRTEQRQCLHFVSSVIKA